MNIIAGISGYFKFSKTHTDNYIFPLHYKFTVSLLVACTIIGTSSLFLKDPISCMSSNKEIPQQVINNYCWVQSTFTLPKKNAEVPYAGVDTATSEETRKYHAYYQWVNFFLIFQAIFFYIPRYLWQLREGKKLEKLLLQLDKSFVGRESYEPQEQAKWNNHQLVRHYATRLSDYLKRSNGCHGFYAHVYYLCEVLNFVNVICQLFLVDAFLDGAFTKHGFDAIAFSEKDQNNRTDALIHVFPRVTKCSFRSFGAGGSIVNTDILCVLSLNMLNERIFILIWFYYIVLAVLSGVMVAYHLAVIGCKWLRSYHLTIGIREKPARKTLRDISRKWDLSDWFLLKLIKQNVDPINFLELVDCLGSASGNLSGSVEIRHDSLKTLTGNKCFFNRS